jgi:hypothetical protein
LLLCIFIGVKDRLTHVILVSDTLIAMLGLKAEWLFSQDRHAFAKVRILFQGPLSGEWHKGMSYAKFAWGGFLPLHSS